MMATLVTDAQTSLKNNTLPITYAPLNRSPQTPIMIRQPRKKYQVTTQCMEQVTKKCTQKATRTIDIDHDQYFDNIAPGCISESTSETPNTAPSLNIRLLNLYDELYKVTSANCFFYKAVEAFLDDRGSDLDPRSYYGLALNAECLARQQEELLQKLEDIRNDLPKPDA